MMKSATFAALLVVGAIPSASAQQASFDCRLARLPDEIAICSDPRLGQLDILGTTAFNIGKQRPGSHDMLASAQALLLARIACKADRLCILDRQVAALRLYQQWDIPIAIPAWVPQYRAELAGATPALSTALPTQVGQCAMTEIAAIGDRFGNALAQEGGKDFDPGTGVSFSNGGVQVSYQHETAIQRSRVGDRVRMCLIEIPQNCPPGDDRGKIYTTTNMRTGEAWSLPDSQHSCGGA
jgi:uncharacterized protein